jgi:hypothetical protein
VGALVDSAYSPRKLLVASSEGVNVVSGATVHADNGRAVHLPPKLIARHMPTHSSIRVETLLSTKQDTVVHFSKTGDIAVHHIVMLCLFVHDNGHFCPV